MCTINYKALNAKFPIFFFLAVEQENLEDIQKTAEQNAKKKIRICKSCREPMKGHQRGKC